MAKFRKRPIVISASRVRERMQIQTREGILWAESGDWLLIGIEGEMYPCADSIFRATYEPMDEEARGLWDEP